MKGTLTIPEAIRELKDKHGIEVSESTLRRRVDLMRVAIRIGYYRVIPASKLARVAKLLAAEGFETTKH